MSWLNTDFKYRRKFTSDNTKVLASYPYARTLDLGEHSKFGTVDDITSADTSENEFQVGADITDDVSVGDNIRVKGSTGNDGTYIVSSVSESGGTTTIGVEEDITDATADGVLQTGIWAKMKTDGADIRITKADGTTEVARGVREFDTTEKEGLIYFNADGISTSEDVDFYIYYGKSDASDYADDHATLGMEKVFSSDYKFYSTMADLTTSSIKDETSNDNDGSKTAANEPNEVDGQLGKGQDFDGDNDYIEIPYDVSFNLNDNITLMAWVKIPITHSGRGGIIQKRKTVANHETYSLALDSDNKLEVQIRDTDGNYYLVYSSATINDGEWHFVVGTISKNDDLYLYIDGVLDVEGSVGTLADIGTITGNLPLWLGRHQTTSHLLEGIIDEARVISSVYSENTQATIYNNESDNATFWTVGDEEQISAPTVTTQAATDVDHNSAKGHGNITSKGGSDVTERGFVYSKTSRSDPGNQSPEDSDYEDVKKETGNYETGAFDLVIDSLDLDTTYYVRAYARNSDGYGYGDEVSFETDEIVETNAATNVKAVTATLNGEAKESGATYFRYRIKDSTGSWTETSKVTQSGVFSVNISGLDLGEEYEFKAMLDYGGDTYEGELLFFETYEGQISGTVELGTGVSGATVRIINQDDDSYLTEITTDSNGYFEHLFDNAIAAGKKYHLAVEYEDGGQKYHAYSLWDIDPTNL